MALYFRVIEGEDGRALSSDTSVAAGQLGQQSSPYRVARKTQERWRPNAYAHAR